MLVFEVSDLTEWQVQMNFRDELRGLRHWFAVDDTDGTLIVDLGVRVPDAATAGRIARLLLDRDACSSASQRGRLIGIAKCADMPGR